MKKLLLSVAVVLGSVLATNAQTISYTAFGSPNIPGTWTQQTHATPNTGWHAGTAFGANMQSHAPAQGDDAFVDDWDNNGTNVNGSDTLYTPVINCTGHASVFLSLNYMFWNDDGNEVGTILCSNDGGHTWTSVYNMNSNYGAWFDSVQVNLTAVAANQANVKLAFTYYNGYPGDGYVAIGEALAKVDIYQPAPYNVQITSQNHASLVQVGTAYPFAGTAENFGGTTITTMAVNYSVNDVPAANQTNTPAGFSALTSANWTITGANSWTPPAPGTYTLRYWATQLNGNANINTDTLVQTFWAVDSVKTRAALLEEYTGQSCVFCMIAAPNIDSVYATNAATSNIVRYHVPIPGRDFMYNETSAQVTVRETYYNVQSYGAPDGFLDGTQINVSTYQNPPENTIYSSVTVQPENAIGSPFTVKVTSATYDRAKDSFHMSATITAHATFAAGLIAQAALTLDSISYIDDMSQDDPRPTFAPPVGTNKNIGFGYPGAPDYYYNECLNFPHVVENMFPSAAGTSLGAFTSGQTQTISYGWKKNHPWGQYPKGGGPSLLDSTLYDSSSTGQIVVWVQTNSAIAADGIPAKYVFQSANAPVSGITTGISGISNNNAVPFKMYPNPTNSNTNLVFKLDKDQSVNVQVYNMLGEVIYTANQNNMSAGSHTITINGSNLQNGVYFVRFTADNVATTQKLIIQR